MGNKCIPEIKGQRKDKMFQNHLSSPSGERAWCYPDLTGSRKGNSCGQLLVFPGWGMPDWQKGRMAGKAARMRKKGQEMLRWAPPKYWCPWSPELLHFGWQLSIQCSCAAVLTGCVQPWSWACPACLGTFCATVLALDLVQLLVPGCCGRWGWLQHCSSVLVVG